MKTIKRAILPLLMVMLPLLIFTSCDCKHEEWNVATCTEPKTCVKCGETEGEALSHKWIEATCDEPKTCEVCGETEGEKLEHIWVDATCKELKTCKICGATEGEKTKNHKWISATCTEVMYCSVCGEKTGKTIDHTWNKATCLNPKTCKVCGVTTGSSLGHDWMEATYDRPKVCSRCGQTDGSPLERPKFNVKLSNAIPSDFNYYYYNGELRDTIRITDISFEYEEDRFHEGEYELIIYFTGEKIYDKNGAGQGRKGVISIKVYDSEGYVVADGTFYTPSLRVGDRFKNEKCSLWADKLPAGSYTVELISTN